MTPMQKTSQQLQLRQIGRGFIVHNDGLMHGRKLTKAYKDQNDKLYITINGEFEPLTEQHNYLAID